MDRDVVDIWEWAETHHGLVRADELRESGFSLHGRRVLRHSDELIALSPRVFRVRGTPRSSYQAALAAVLDAGRGVAVAGLSAAWLWRLRGFDFVEPVTLTSGKSSAQRHRPTLGVVRERRLFEPHHVTEVDGVPVITLPVLLYQLGAILKEERFIRVADTVIARSPGVLLTMHQLLPELGRRGRNGIAVIRRYLDERPVGCIPPSGLERRFEKLVDEGSHRPLRRQVDVGGHEWIGRTDYVDPETHLIVEIQSATYHSSVTDRAGDERRIARLLSAGFPGVLEIDDDVVWYRPHLIAPALALARSVIRSSSVRWLDRPGLRFHRTERPVGLGGEGRMSA